MQVTDHARYLVTLLILSVALVILPGDGGSRCHAQAVSGAQVEEELKRLTPEEIEARLKQLGLTKEEATKRAAALGINLDQYLQASHPPPLQEKPPLSQPPSDSGKTKTEVSVAAPKQIEREPIPLSPDGLPYFGYEIFRHIPEAFEPTAVGPVDPEYLIGPEDVLKVAVWGQVEFENEYTVDAEGKIFISTIGKLLVSGLTLDQVNEKLVRQMSRSYSGLVSQPRTVWLDVSLAKLKPKRVFIIGEVSSPGGYTVSSYATVFNALYSIGGPTVNGSLRDVRVIRGGKVISRVDLYNYLLGADQTEDIRVQSNDIIFVPVRGKTVSIRGGVRRPATYELKEGDNFSALLRFCGGLLPSAYGTTAQVERIRPMSERTGSIEDRYIIDVDLKDVLYNNKDPDLFDADDIQVFQVLDVMRNYATISGSVWRPGKYDLGRIKTVRDLLMAAEGVQPRTYMQLAHLIRYNDDQVTTRIIPFNLQGTLEDSLNSRLLMPRDEVIVYSTEVVEVKNKHVTIRGEVKKPGQYTFRDSLSLDDLVLLAGGYTEEADVLEAEVSRVVPGGYSGDSLAILLHPQLPTTFLSRDESGNLASGTDGHTDGYVENPLFRLQHRDEVLIRTNPHFRSQENVTISGDIMYPGTYTVQKRGEHLSELLTRAGGPTSLSYLGGGEFYRNNERVLLDFEEAYYRKGELHDIIVRGGDSIAIPSKPNTVKVTGEVNKPGLLSYRDGDKVRDYIDRAGGLTDSAYFALLTEPTGESRKVGFGLFDGNPAVPEGSTIEIAKEPPPPPVEKGESVSTTIKDIFALLASAAALVFIVHETTK